MKERISRRWMQRVWSDPSYSSFFTLPTRWKVYVCVEVRVDFEREEMPETNNCSSKEFIAVYIVNLRLHWWSSLFPSKLRRDWILDWFSKGSRLDSNWFLLSMNINFPSNNYSRRKNVIKMDLERTNGGWFSKNHGLSCLEARILATAFPIARHLTRANMIYEAVSITIAFPIVSGILAIKNLEQCETRS